MPAFYIRLTGTEADGRFVFEDKNSSRKLNVVPEQMLKDAPLLMLRWVSRHGRKLLLAAAVPAKCLS